MSKEMCIYLIPALSTKWAQRKATVAQQAVRGWCGSSVCRRHNPTNDDLLVLRRELGLPGMVVEYDLQHAAGPGVPEGPPGDVRGAARAAGRTGDVCTDHRDRWVDLCSGRFPAESCRVEIQCPDGWNEENDNIKLKAKHRLWWNTGHCDAYIFL